MNIKRHFVFLSFTRPDIAGVINFLASTLQERLITEAPHLTIQGPFEEKAKISDIATIKKRLSGDTFFIGNPGIFDTPRGAALFLRVQSDNLRRVWNKPDYPIERYGFNPHITLYEGEDSARVHRALRVLTRHRIELLCDEIEVTQYVPKQMDMFPLSPLATDEDALTRLVVQGRLTSNFRSIFMQTVAGKGK